MSAVGTSTSVGNIVIDDNGSIFVINTSVARFISGFGLPSTRLITNGLRTGGVFDSFRSLGIPAITTVGNVTLNNNLRVYLTTSCHIVSAGTGVNLPRIGLNVCPNFNNAIHLPHLVNTSGTVR